MKPAEWNLPRAETQTVDHQNDPIVAVKKRKKRQRFAGKTPRP